MRAAATALLSRDTTVAEAIAAVTSAMGAGPDELVRHEQEGRGRAAAMLVARKFAGDPLDPIEVESIARKLRRWRRKKFGHCPDAADENV